MTKVLVLQPDGSYQEVDIELAPLNYDGGGVIQPPNPLVIDMGGV